MLLLEGGRSEVDRVPGGPFRLSGYILFFDLGSGFKDAQLVNEPSVCFEYFSVLVLYFTITQ